MMLSSSCIYVPESSSLDYPDTLPRSFSHQLGEGDIIQVQYDKR
jgi:hypothetical protein